MFKICVYNFLKQQKIHQKSTLIETKPALKYCITTIFSSLAGMPKT